MAAAQEAREGGVGAPRPRGGHQHHPADQPGQHRHGQHGPPASPQVSAQRQPGRSHGDDLATSGPWSARVLGTPARASQHASRDTGSTPTGWPAHASQHLGPRPRERRVCKHAIRKQLAEALGLPDPGDRCILSVNAAGQGVGPWAGTCALGGDLRVRLSEDDADGARLAELTRYLAVTGLVMTVLMTAGTALIAISAFRSPNFLSVPGCLILLAAAISSLVMAAILLRRLLRPRATDTRYPPAPFPDQSGRAPRAPGAVRGPWTSSNPVRPRPWRPLSADPG